MNIRVSKDILRVGVISDTHGQVRKQLFNVFSGVEYILHAGDIGSVEIIKTLEKIAPVCAITGNNDSRNAFTNLSDTAVFETERSRIMLIHDCNQINRSSFSIGINAVICGHTHSPMIEYRENVLFLNPGSAGPRRFDLPVSVAILEIFGNTLKPVLKQITI